MREPAYCLDALDRFELVSRRLFPSGVRSCLPELFPDIAQPTAEIVVVALKLGVVEALEREVILVLGDLGA